MKICTRKRPGRRLKMKATKKSKMQKTDSDLEEEEQLKAFLMIVPDEEGIIDYEVLEKRSDRSSRWIKTFSEMVTRKIGILQILGFNNENYGVHTLILEDGTKIRMLAEKKYPLTKETLERMFSLRLVARTASEDAYTLLIFIQKQIDEYGSHDGGEKHQEAASPEANGIWERLLKSMQSMFIANEALVIPEQTATGKEISNSFMDW
ncbi:hypothetical protein Tco_1504205 [Tanacetum coccineum]